MKFKVTERRCYHETYIIEADSRRDAEQRNGAVLEEGRGDCWGEDLVSVEELPDDEDDDFGVAIVKG
jgi:hypothetical protein